MSWAFADVLATTQPDAKRQSNVAGITVTTNGAGDITSLLGKTLAYDSAGRLSDATAVPPCPSGTGCVGEQTTTSRYNGMNQRYLRESPAEQSVFSYGLEGHNLLSQTTRDLNTSRLSTTEHIWLPSASGPMPVATVIDGVHFAVHADHLNTPRRLSDATGQTRWQWPYSGFGEVNPQATPAAGQAAVSYSLRYPGQMDDGNGLFYNWHRAYDPRVGRYTQADPTGLDGGWNRFASVSGNPFSYIDPEGLETIYNLGPVTFVAYPGPPATDFRAEHGSKTGAGHHVHTFMNGREGPRILTGTFRVYPGDEKLCTGPFKDALTKLNEGEKQYIKRAQMQVFNDGNLGPRLQNVRVRTMLPRLMGGGAAKGRE